jgi:sulfide:quinone oxidoreductase
MSPRSRVVVVGGGVAALEACLALRARAGDRVSIALIAPNTYFGYRPQASHDPLGVRGHVRVPLARVAQAAGADLHRDRVTDIDPAGRRVYTAAGYELAYDALVVATGAVPLDVPAGTVAFDPRRVAYCRSVQNALARGDVGSLAFVEPAGPAQGLELYELALDTAVAARREGAAPAVSFVTAHPAPLAVAGALVADTLRLTLASHGVRLVDSAYVRGFADGELDVVPGAHRLFAESVIAAPRLGGRRLPHVPCDADGFVPVDPLGRVPGLDSVFAAGDCTAFPVKHPSLAAQQADAVAATIAGACEPFRPVLRCMLPSRLRWYVEAPLTGGHGDATRISAHPLWPGDARFAARHLTPWLADLEHQARSDRADDAGDDEPVDDAHHAAAAMAAH